jgi:cytochrome P450
MAVEESLLYFSNADPIPRLATEDVEVGGMTVKAGENVIASGLAANSDPDTLTDETGHRRLHQRSPRRRRPAIGPSRHRPGGRTAGPGRSAAALIATHTYHSVLRLDVDGNRSDVATYAQGIAGPTAVALAADRTSLFVCTTGGLLSPAADAPEPARLLQIDPSRNRRYR